MIQQNPNSPTFKQPDPQGLLEALRRQDSTINRMGECIDRLTNSIDDAVHVNEQAHVNSPDTLPNSTTAPRRKEDVPDK